MHTTTHAPALRITGLLTAINEDAPNDNPAESIWSLLFTSEAGKPVVITGVRGDYARQLTQLDPTQPLCFAITIQEARQ